MKRKKVNKGHIKWKPTNVNQKVNPAVIAAKPGKIKDMVGEIKGKSRIESRLIDQLRGK